MVVSPEGLSGKSVVALGILEGLGRSSENVGIFRPVSPQGSAPDLSLALLLSHPVVNIQPERAVGVNYDDVRLDPESAMAEIIRKYRDLESKCDVTLVLGSDYTEVGNPAEFEFNAKIAANLGIPIVLVVTGRDTEEQVHRGLAAAPTRLVSDIARVARSALDEICDAHAQAVGVVINRAAPENLDQIVNQVSLLAPGLQVSAIPEEILLVAPTAQAILEAVDGELIHGDQELLDREALGVMVAAMGLETVLARLQEGHIVLIPGDRHEILLGVMLAHHSQNFPNLSGIVLYGGFHTPPVISTLLEGVNSALPVITTSLDTFETVLHVTAAKGKMAADSKRKYHTALRIFRDSVDVESLLEALRVPRSSVVTPLMFEYDLVERARAANRHIVLPEGQDDRILYAAATLLSRGVDRLTLLGDENLIRARARELGLNIDQAAVVSPEEPELVERFAVEYQKLRAQKGVTLEQARDIVRDVSYFGTMMVHLGLVDGMVSGATHTTAHTITPSFQIIKTQPDVSVVSSVFLMCLEDRVLLYGDCAIVPQPTAAQLADIAASAADTAAQFGIEPRVAMLSYSTGESGHGSEVEKVREATSILRQKRPDLLVEGPIQYDAAAEPSVAATKMPDSAVAGRATVFVFPDLNTGNNTYKAVQRSAGAVAIGPVLQGLNKPVNDLSRGATVRDIVNTVAITAIQAEQLGDPST